MQREAATVADAAALAGLVNAAYRGSGGRHGWTHEAALIAGDRAGAAEIAALIAGGRATVLVRREGGALAGCVAVEPEGAGIAAISMLAVRPERQGAALGRALLAEAERFAAADGASLARITVVAQREDLLGWYERRGTCGSGMRPSPTAIPASASRSGAILRFVVFEKPL